MKWIYGKQDIKTLERGQENCYLLANGLGGFSSLTMIGSAARNDHALLMGCTQAPNHRYNLIHRLREVLETKKEKKVLSSQEFDGGTAEEGYRYLSSFTFEDTPVWRYEAGGVQVRKEIGMPHMENTVAVVYEIENETLEAVTLQVTPFLQFVRKGEDLKEEQNFQWDGNSVISNGIGLFFETNGEILQKEETETCYYSYDVCDGRRPAGRTKAVLQISLRVPARKTGGWRSWLRLVLEERMRKVFLRTRSSTVKNWKSGQDLQHRWQRCLPKVQDNSFPGESLRMGRRFWQDTRSSRIGAEIR